MWLKVFYASWLCNPPALSTLYRCPVATVSQVIPNRLQAIKKELTGTVANKIKIPLKGIARAIMRFFLLRVHALYIRLVECVMRTTTWFHVSDFRFFVLFCFFFFLKIRDGRHLIHSSASFNCHTLKTNKQTKTLFFVKNHTSDHTGFFFFCLFCFFVFVCFFFSSCCCCSNFISMWYKCLQRNVWRDLAYDVPIRYLCHYCWWWHWKFRALHENHDKCLYFVPHDGVWTKSYDPNFTKFWAFLKKNG